MQNQNRTQLWLNGKSGRMGQEIQALLKSEQGHDFSLVGGSDGEAGWGENIDCVLDFSTVAGNRQLLDMLGKHREVTSAVIIGTTGLSKEVLGAWETFAVSRQQRVLVAPNTSLGISLCLASMMQLGPVCFAHNFDAEIYETHHRQKKDSPSGTALFLAEQLAEANPGTRVVAQRSGERRKNEIGIQVSRGGGVFGEHQIRFLGDDEEFTLTHRAFSRRAFARGALFLCSWLREQPPGYYTLRDYSPNSGG